GRTVRRADQGAFQEGTLAARQAAVVRQQARHLGAEAGVVPAGSVEEGTALRGGQFHSLVEQGPHLFAPRWGHVPSSASGDSPPPICRASQARARRQSRYTVRSDAPTTCAISSTVNPV